MGIVDRLQEVFQAVFGEEGRITSDDDGPGSIPGWDSVNHVNLILAIEAEFGVQFDAGEIPDLVTVGQIKARLAEPR